MSKKVSLKASITNRPTCGGSKKAGLAPRSTNFMMGVKRNHHFRGQPFYDNKNSTDYVCNLEPEPITGSIGFLNPITGIIDQWAPGFASAANKAIEDLNTKHGSNLILIEGDSGCDGTAAASAATDLLASGVIGVVGAACSGASMGANSVLKNDVPMISYAATSPLLSDNEAYPNFFRVVPSDGFQGEALADLIHSDNSNNARPVVIFNMTNSYGRELRDALTTKLSEYYGYSDITTIEYDESTIDFSFVQDWMDDNSSLKDNTEISIVLVSYASDGANIIRRLLPSRFNCKIYGGDGVAEEGFMRLLQDYGLTPDQLNLIQATKPQMTSAYDPNSDFKNGCKQHPDCSIGIYTAEAYDAITIMGEAYINSVNNSTSINDEIFNLGNEYQGESGEITFRQNGDSWGDGYGICVYTSTDYQCGNKYWYKGQIITS